MIIKIKDKLILKKFKRFKMNFEFDKQNGKIRLVWI